MAKLIVVASKFAPHAGGTSVVWTNWCKHWAGHDLTVIAPQMIGALQHDRQQAYRIVRCGYPEIPKIRMPWLWLHQALQLTRLCLQLKPDFVHFSHVFENGFMGPILKRMVGTPYFVHTYAEELMWARRVPLVKSLVKNVLQKANGVTAISHFTSRLVQDFGYSASPLLVHPAVDTQRFHPGQGSGTVEARGIPEGPRLLTLGRLMERKGHARIFNLLPRLLPEFPTLQYIIAGTGPYETNLRNLVDSMSLNLHVHFLGRVADSEIVPLIQECTIFVHPSIVTSSGDVEGFGIVFLEAAACEIPVIGTNTGGIPDSVQDGVNGYLIDSDEELYQALRKLLLDPGLREKMGRAGRTWACRFDWKTAADRVWKYSLQRVANPSASLQGLV